MPEWLLYSSTALRERCLDNVEILQLRAKFQTEMVSCLRFICITNSNDHRYV